MIEGLSRSDGPSIITVASGTVSVAPDYVSLEVLPDAAARRPMLSCGGAAAEATEAPHDSA